MSEKFGQNPNSNRDSGEINCRENNGGQTNNSGGGNNQNNCVTVSGGTVGSACAFPFRYQGKEYRGCTVADANDGKQWCSIKTDDNGNHIGGQGLWGHCPTPRSNSCPVDLGKSLTLF